MYSIKTYSNFNRQLGNAVDLKNSFTKQFEREY